MAKAVDSWKVLAHEPIVELADNLWWVRGSLPGMSLKRTMTVLRLADGRLVIHNAIALDEPSMARIEAWGTPAFLVVPSEVHRLDAPAYKTRYPSLQVYAPRGSSKAVSDVIALDGTYDDFPHLAEVRFEPLHGIQDKEGAMIVHSADGTSVVLNDALFNMDTKKDVLGYLFTTILGSAPGPRVSRLAKLLLIKDKAALRGDFERFAQIPDLVRLIVAHEKVASGPEAKQAFLMATRYL